MPITKQQRVYFGVLAVAVAAWATDRFVLKGGATAPLGAQASSLLIVHDSSVVPAPAPLAHVNTATLGERLEHFASESGASSPARDVFSPPDSWLPLEKPVVSAEVSQGPSVEEFRHAHKLTAVVRAGRNSQIFMGEQIVHLGQSVDGFRLVNVTESSATFSTAAGSPVTLELETASDVGAGSSGMHQNTDGTSLKRIAPSDVIK